MHIGFIEDTHLHGGTQIWVAEAIQIFIQNNHKLSLLAPKGSWIVEKCRNSGAEITTYDWDEVIQKDTRNQEIWTNALRDCDIAICTVHPPREGFHCSVFAAYCIKEGGLKTHLIPKTGTIVPEYLREFYLPDQEINTSIITITDFTRRYLIETYDISTEKVVLIYQGTDLDRFRHSTSAQEEARKRYPLPINAVPILGVIGSFEPRKGHLVLFEAMKELVKNTLPNAHLMVVGDGPNESMLKDTVKTLGLEDHISFFPFTNEPNFVFERLDITILPSLYKEGLPNVLLESMAMGKPVISSNIGGVSEIVIDGETGYMVEPGNKTALANAINTIWENQDKYPEMQLKAANLIAKHFDKAIQFNKFISYFHELKKLD